MKHEHSISVAVAAKVYGKDPAWVRAGIISGYLPIGTATRNGKKVTSVEEIRSGKGRINYYISPKLFYEHTGVLIGEPENDDQDTSLPKNRYLELKYFCMQYTYWKKAYSEILLGRSPSSESSLIFQTKGSRSDRTSKEALAAVIFKDKIKLVESCCKKACYDQSLYLLESVTNCVSYKDLKHMYPGFTMSEPEFDNAYKKFFRELNERRN